MNEARASALRRLERARAVRDLINVLRALLEHRMTRPQAAAWAAELRSSGGPTFDSATALAVFDALAWVDERDGDGQQVRDVDLHAYLAELRGGACFVGDRDPLVRLRLDLDQLAERVGTKPTRWWCSGLGWFEELRFATLASERPFVATAAQGQREHVDVYKLARDPWRDALIDLFEHLVVDDHDAIAFDPAVNLAELPVWALWREDDNANRFEMERYRSYSKAELHERIYRERGHKQFYWVDPVE